MGARCIYFENKYYVTCNGGDGLSVIRIGKGVSLDSEARVYIATRGVSHERICEILNNCGITDIVPVNAELDMRLRNQFVNAYFKEMHWTFSKLDYSKALRNHDDEVDKSSVIYAVKSEADSPLATDVPLERYESFIQAGRALADEQLKECRYVDNTGDNISDRNRQMCELTAMYWIWKNADAEVVGIEHYRRRFLLPASWSAIIQDGDADVILPVPLYVSPSIKDNYVSRHDIGPWNSMLKQIDRIYGEECLEKATVFLKTPDAIVHAIWLLHKEKYLMRCVGGCFLSYLMY